MTLHPTSRLLYAKHFKQPGISTKLSRQGLVFDCVITASERRDACLYGTDSAAPWRILAVQRPPTKVILNPESPTERELYTQLRPDADFNIVYGLSPDRTTRPRWTTDLDEGDVFFEGQECLLVAQCGADTIGFSKFGVFIRRDPEEEKTTNFEVLVDLVYVRPRCRGAGYGLDLSIACSRICDDVFKALLHAAPDGETISVGVFADFESEGGDRFVTYVIDKLKAAIDLAPIGHAGRHLRLKPVVFEGGY